GVVTALLMGATLLSLATFFARLPKAALAAVIVVAVARLIDIATLRDAWRYQRSDAVVLLATLLSVLVLGIEVGLVAGIVLSLLIHVWRGSRPHMAIVGRVPGTEHFRNIRRHDVETWPPLALVRVDESLTFTNIGVVEDFVGAHLAGHRDVQHVILLGNAVKYIDSSALDSLERFIASLREAGVTVHLAEVKGPVLDALERVDFPARIAPGRVFFRTADAVAALAKPHDVRMSERKTATG
ncbi:MAG TPA: STAS domain-containing protein, partial [Burkholderiales bacterium]|nr:STAS domain-containing protein [Burkholderiales bacterium]